MVNPYEPPKEDSKRRITSSDRWGERHRPPITDWTDVFFVFVVVCIMWFSPYLIKLVSEVIIRLI